MRTLISLLSVLVFGLPVFTQNIGPDDLVFSGIVAEYNKSDQGQDYQIKVISHDKQDSIIGSISADMVRVAEVSEIIRRRVKIIYRYQLENQLYSIDLQSRHSTGQKTDRAKILAVEGRLNTCTCGDMDGYVDIETADGTIMEFQAGLYSPEDIFRGDDVGVFYKEVTTTEIRSLQFLEE